MTAPAAVTPGEWVRTRLVVLLTSTATLLTLETPNGHDVLGTWNYRRDRWPPPFADAIQAEVDADEVGDRRGDWAVLGPIRKDAQSFDVRDNRRAAEVQLKAESEGRNVSSHAMPPCARS